MYYNIFTIYILYILNIVYIGGRGDFLSKKFVADFVSSEWTKNYKTRGGWVGSMAIWPFSKKTNFW